MTGVSLGFAFSAGLVASLNPCAFAMLPAFAAYYLGLDEEGPARPAPARAARGLAVGAAMTSGFVLVFAAIGALVSLAGSGLLRYQDVVTVAVALGLAALGAWLAGGRELHVAVPNPVRGSKGGRDLLSAGLYGLGYGLASLACTLPIFLIVVGAAFLEGSLADGLVLFLAYSAGMGAVVMAVSVSTALFKTAVARLLRRALPFVQRASGALLILAGTYLAVRQLDQARLGTLSGLQPYAVEIGASLAAASAAVAALLHWLGREEAAAEPSDREAGATGEAAPGRGRELELSRRA